MISLRTRKPSESHAKVQRSGSKHSRPIPRDGRRATRVDDKIKKRMSTRYAEISSPTGASVPAVPALPIGLRAGPHRAQDESVREPEQPREDSREADLRILDQDNFDPDAYLKSKMAHSTEAELKSLQSSLRASKDEVAQDLQRNVFKNYAEFVLVSKEVSTLENEMLEFKEALAEWKGMPSLLHIDDSASVAERRRNVRSSIADLRVLYANQMQSLHTQIEGSAKFVPTTPGRHVIIEMDGILALNPATYKVDHSVRFVLLDDAVLVAKRRQRRNNTESDKLIAERCWPLNEILVLDTKDSSSMRNVFKIRHNKETYVYRTELAADKKNLLHQFRHVAEELAAKKRKEREDEYQRRKSLWVGGDRTSQAYISEMPPLPDFLADLNSKSDSTSGSKDKAERDARWMSDFTDDLTVAIALRKWEQAVSLVEEGEGRYNLLPTLPAKLTPLKASLTSALLQTLSHPTNRKSTVVNLISLLIRLKAGAAARSTFLAARSEVMHKRVRMLTFEGHIPMYIGDLATITFTGIKHTADWFLASFKENEVASCFVEWAKQQMEHYAEMFRQQVYSSDVDREIVQEAIDITHSQSKKLLEEYGLNFRYLLDKLLVENPEFNSEPPPARPLIEKRPEPRRGATPAQLQIRAPTSTIVSPRPTRSQPPSVPSSANISSFTSTVTLLGRDGSPLPSPAPSPAPAFSSPRIRSPVPRVPSTTTNVSRPSTPSSDIGSRLARPPRASPAPPPPRSRDRPGSGLGHRPPPVAVPRREGMF